MLQTRKRIQSAVILSIGLAISGISSVFAETPVAWKTGNMLTAELQQTLSGRWEGGSFRQSLQELSQSRGVAVVLDRRLDPTDFVGIEAQAESLEVVFRKFAAARQAHLVRLDSLLYIGPPDAADRLRTVIAQQQERWNQRSALSSSSRTTVEWKDLTTPTEILGRIGALWSLEFTAATPLPHDHWAQATLPQVTPVEALAVVLGQFDAAVKLDDVGPGLTIVPVESAPQLVRQHRLPAKTGAARLKGWKERWPEARVESTPQSTIITVHGSLEAHDDLVATLSGNRAVPPTPKKANSREKDRKFTLRIEKAPLAAVLQELQKMGFTINYDEADLKRANIDLQTRVSVTARELSAEEFLDELLQGCGLDYRLEGATIELFPSQR